MIFTYPMLIHDDPDDLWAEFPDLVGCQTFGHDMKELHAMAQEALELYISEEIAHSGKVPPASDFREWKLEEHTYSSMVSVDVDIAKYSRSVKKTLTIPYWLNEEATARGINFSQALQEALLAKLA